MRRKPIFRTRNVNSSMRYVHNSRRDKHGKKYLKHLRFFSWDFPDSEYKGVIHRGKFTMYGKLAGCHAKLGSVVFTTHFTTSLCYMQLVSILYLQL